MHNYTCAAERTEMPMRCTSIAMWLCFSCMLFFTCMDWIWSLYFASSIYHFMPYGMAFSGSKLACNAAITKIAALESLARLARIDVRIRRHGVKSTPCVRNTQQICVFQHTYCSISLPLGQHIFLTSSTRHQRRYIQFSSAFAKVLGKIITHSLDCNK